MYCACHLQEINAGPSELKQDQIVLRVFFKVQKEGTISLDAKASYNDAPLWAGQFLLNAASTDNTDLMSPNDNDDTVSYIQHLSR